MARSHRKHGQDKTVLSCLVGGVNWVRDSLRQFSVYWRPVLSAVWTHLWTSLDPVSKYDVTIGNHVACESKTGSGQDKTQFTPHYETGQNCFEIFSRRQSWLVANSVHTANTDKTRQGSLVLSVFAVWTIHKKLNSKHKLKWQQSPERDSRRLLMTYRAEWKGDSQSP